MPRRAAAGARPLDPDSQHGSKLVQQLINRVMVDGKKSTAEQIVYDALDKLSQKTGEEPTVALENSIKALTPASPTSARTTSTAWRRQIKPSPTTAGKSRRREPPGGVIGSLTG